MTHIHSLRCNVRRMIYDTLDDGWCTAQCTIDGLRHYAGLRSMDDNWPAVHCRMDDNWPAVHCRMDDGPS